MNAKETTDKKKTGSPKATKSDAKPAVKDVMEWHLFDAESTPLGRMATHIATLLQGKHRVDFAPNVVAPVSVVVINSDKLQVTGDKMAQKTYYRYSGYPGGMRERTLGEQMQRDSKAVIQRAVSGMLPKNNLRDDLMNHLKIYPGAEHPHTQMKKEKTSK